MPRTARGSLLLAAVAIGILVFVVGQAAGGPAPTSAIPQLHAPVSLSGVPHVSVPSLPRVSVPSVPRVSVPSTPSLSTVPRSVTGAAGAAGRGVGGTGTVRSLSPGAGAAASTGGGPGASSAGSGRSSGAARGERMRAASHAQRRRNEAAHDRRLRRDVTRLAGCLDTLSSLEARLLSLRAGLGDDAPASRPEAARKLGISTHRAAVLERNGLHRLRGAGRSGACGGVADASGPSASPAAIAARAGTGPQLQPAVLLTPRPRLASPASLGRSRHSRGAGGGSSSNSGTAPPASGGRTPGVIHGVETSSQAARYIVGFALLTLLLAAFAVAWRRRERGAPPRLADEAGSAIVWQAPAAPVEAPPAAEPPAPAAEATAPTAGPPAPAPEPPPLARARPVAVVAATLLSLGVALLRRRRR